MTWYDETANETAAAQPHAEVVEFVQVEFPSGFVNAHTRTGTITWGGYDWLGVGSLGTISDLSEDSMLRPNGITITLSGVTAAIVDAVVEDDYHGYPIRVYNGLLDVDTMQLVATPQLRFRGLIDTADVELGQNTGTVTLHCESELARWDRHRGLLFTNESQQALFPGDKGFDRIPIIQNRTIDWTKKSQWGTALFRNLGTAMKGST